MKVSLSQSIYITIFILLLTTITISASFSITVDNPDSLYENTPVIFTLTTTETIEQGKIINFTTTTSYTTPDACYFYSAPTAHDLIRDPSDSHRQYGNCFPFNDNTISGDDAIATLTQYTTIIDGETVTPLDCTSHDIKPLLTFKAKKLISSGTKFRCLGKFLSAPQSITTQPLPIRQFDLQSTADTSISISLAIKPVETNFKVNFIDEFAQVEDQRYILTQLIISTTNELPLPQILQLSAYASYTTLDIPSTTILSSNLYFNVATYGSYKTQIQPNPWSLYCTTDTTYNNVAARLYVSDYQPGPTITSTIPIAHNYTLYEQVSLIVQPKQKNYICTLPLAIPIQPMNTETRLYTPITFYLGTTKYETNLPYRLLPLIDGNGYSNNEIKTTPITDARVYSITNTNIATNNASVTYIFNMHIDFPLYSVEYMTQDPLPNHPTIKYKLKPNKVFGENQGLDDVISLLFPQGESTVIWSILTPTTEHCTFDYDYENKEFNIIYTSPLYATKPELFSFQVRFSTVSFSPPINANSRQTNFDLAFNLYEVKSSSTDLIQLNKRENDLLFRIRPALLLDSYSLLARRDFADIKFTARFRSLGFPTAQSGTPQWSTNEIENEQNFPQLRCWVELNDDIFPDEIKRGKGTSMSITVSGQESAGFIGTKYRTSTQTYRKGKNYFWVTGYRNFFGGKLQYTTLDVFLPVSTYGKFPYKQAFASLGCKFSRMSPVTMTSQQFINNDPTTPNLYPLRFQMDETSSYVKAYTFSTNTSITTPLDYSATVTPLMFKVTSTKEISTQYDLEIIQAAVFDTLKKKLESTNNGYKTAMGALNFFQFKFYVPYNTNLRLRNQGHIIDTSRRRTESTSQLELAQLPLTQAFSSVARIHTSKTTSLTTTGLNDPNIYKVNTANDVSGKTGSMFHVLVDPQYLARFNLNTIHNFRPIIDTFTLPSTVRDWNKNIVRIELLSYDINKDPDRLGGYPYQPNCDVMVHRKKFNALGYQYPGVNPTCGPRPVGQKCFYHNQCGAGTCNGVTGTCQREFDSIGMIANSTAYDLMDSIIERRNDRFTWNNAFKTSILMTFGIMFIAIIF